MKKLIVVSALGLLMISGFSSCKQCQVCTKSSEPEVRVCEKDYGSATEYGLAIDVLEGGGYNCKGAI
ncbi:MAG TPA: hypothetical protein VK174_04745 [Chitinophagales bacterium]|nr:hypothetical protein [Chitinophagales bacterium]